MRLIYRGGRRVGPDPVRHYVYLWRHGEVDRYVGRGTNGRWAAHLKTSPNDNNQPKSLYFAQYGAEMEAFIVAEGFAGEGEAAPREILEIDTRGFEADQTGTLLNDRGGSTFYEPRAPRGQRKDKGNFDWRLFSRLRREGRFAPNALIYKLAPDSLKTPRSPGRRYFDEVYPPLGTSVTVADHLKRGKERGFADAQQSGHMACDFCRGLIGMTLPEGETIAPGHIVPTKNLLARLALEVGTEAEWLRHCALRASQGCQIGG